MGAQHALMGISSLALMQSHAFYQELALNECTRQILSARDRYRLSMILDRRVRADMVHQVQACEHLADEWFEPIQRPYPDAAMRWADVLDTELTHLAALRGIWAVGVIQEDDSGAIMVEASAGALGGALTCPDDGGAHAVPCQTLRREVWQDQAIRRVNHAAPDADPPLRVANARLMVPVLDASLHTVSLIEMWGAFPYQFESAWMQRFAIGLQQRWQDLWKRRSQTLTVVGHDVARTYRTRLFQGGLRIHVQPVINLSSGAVVRYEALARLHIDDRLIPPGHFLPLLGDAELNQLFLRTTDLALSAVKTWESSGIHTSISVNAAPSTLVHPDIPRWVLEALEKHHLQPSRLALEVLESQQVDGERQRQAMLRLRSLGVHLAMDDLGSGYSSLVRLMDNPFHTFKVDGGVLKNIYSQPLQTLLLVDTLVRLGQDLDRFVIIEGLEDEGMLEAVTQLGARYGQGYILARPMPIDHALEWHRTGWRPAPVGAVHTVLGALAYHWKMAHDPPHRHPGPLGQCRITALVDAARALEPAVATWHAALHDQPNLSEASERLTQWLLTQVKLT